LVTSPFWAQFLADGGQRERLRAPTKLPGAVRPHPGFRATTKSPVTEDKGENGKGDDGRVDLHQSGQAGRIGK
jgi:hypothetical protein